MNMIFNKRYVRVSLQLLAFNQERKLTCKEMDFDRLKLHPSSLHAIFLPLYSWKRDDESWGDLSGFKLKKDHQSF